MTRNEMTVLAKAINRRRITEGCHCDAGPAQAALDALAVDLCTVLVMDHPRFDRARFLAACGVPQ